MIEKVDTVLKFHTLAVSNPDELIFGRSPNPVTCGFDLTIGNGQVYPEINFTLPPISIEEKSWSKVLCHYEEIITSLVRRAKALSLPGLVVEFEQLPEMTQNPQWGAEITSLLHTHLKRLYEDHGIPNALRVTVVDLRCRQTPPILRDSPDWNLMHESFICSAQAGADILSIESTGGKEVHDEALLYGDLTGIVAALGILGCRDMAWLWEQIVDIAGNYHVIAGGDSACGFSNTAMQLAGKGMLPSVLAAIDRAASAPRSLEAFEHGAVGPSKDCAYEGPVMKAIAGCPISMEGKSAVCAHLSPLGNIAGAMADLWSNESVQNIRLLSGPAPEAFLELLAYDCRLFNAASESHDALRLRNWLVAGDVPLSVEALILDPTVVYNLAKTIVAEKGGYARTLAAVRFACEAIRRAIDEQNMKLNEREVHWFDRLCSEAESIPADEKSAMIFLKEKYGHLFLPSSYSTDVTHIFE